ncbi:formate dehydrogenase subunit delta [Pseudonocardia sp. GCM10023141]|uniref:formate dehydrogenase subunit delta n=1 Tax=Pseudonocardia sp. GCM10023141 TaxID=3252653 RepID=UPI00360E5006
MAGDVALHFRHRPPEQAARAVAEHLRSFWDPRMRRTLLAAVDAGTDVDPLVVRATALLRETG